MNDIILVDLFSGIGGFALGFKNAGFEFSHHYYSDIDEYAKAVYKINFKDARELKPVEFISGKQLRERHPKGKFIVTFGFPCQDLSLAGRRKGFTEGERSNLFFEAIRIIDELKPKIWIAENVTGFLSSNDGRDFAIALIEIAKLGDYIAEWQILNSSWILPQNRERVFIVGHLTGGSRIGIFPFKENDKLVTTTRWQTDNKRAKKRIYSSKTARCLVVSMHKKNLEQDYVECKKRNGEIGIRSLTEIECERLQGFPDNWTQYGLFNNGSVSKISTTQRYIQLGNAVTVDIIKLIAERIQIL